MNKFINKFIKKIHSETEEFYKRMISESPEYVYFSCEEICFIRTVYDMFYSLLATSNAEDNVNLDIIKWLDKKDKPLEFLYQEFTKEHYVFSQSWDELLDIIERLFQVSESSKNKK